MIEETKVHTEIDYLGILHYLENNRGKPYKSPDNAETEEQRQNYLDLYTKSTKATSELKKIYELCQKKFGLTFCVPIRWLRGNNEQIRYYLWVQMKYKEYQERRESISIFVDMANNKQAHFRISLSLKTENATEEDIKQFNRHLDKHLNVEAGLFYLSSDGILIDSKDIDILKQKVKKNEYLKDIQIAKYIENNKTNDEYEEDILSAVENILPYYKYIVESNEQSSVSQMKENKYSVDFDKNIILYGPPGTGKTYSTVMYAVAICDGFSLEQVKSMEYAEVLQRYKELKDEGRIAFTTFHQSYGYEEFIEGIKPVMAESSDSKDIDYKIEDGIFKEFCNKASEKKIFTSVSNGADIGTRVSNSAKVWSVILGGRESPELTKQCFDESSIRIGWSKASKLIEESDDSLNDVEKRIILTFQNEMNIGDVVVSRASATEINGIGIIVGDYEYDDSNPRYPRKRQVEWLYINKNIDIFNINGETRLARKSVYHLVRITPNDILKLLPDNSKVKIEDKPYVFIIDEINRGNISKILGELITLIEVNKRKGASEEMSVSLPYSRQNFSVPNNVYILGTLNTADRSIALMDIALRRRFSFIEMMPNFECLENVKVIDEKANIEVNIGQMLKIINERITFLYDREHTIGHAFFMELVQDNRIEKLASIFKKSIIPLLQEYFYDDYEKIRLVLGDNAKREKNIQFIISDDIGSDLFDVDVSDSIDISSQRKYTINDESFNNIWSYKGISKSL